MSGIGQIEAFAKRLQKLATPDLRRELSQKLGGVMIRLINKQIDQGVDPYGMPWKKRIADGKTALQGLKNTFTASFSNGHIRVSSNKWYALVHQAGWVIAARNAPYLRFKIPGGGWMSKKTVTIPRRQLIPTQREGLSESWNAALMTASDQFFRDRLQGRG